MSQSEPPTPELPEEESASTADRPITSEELPPVEPPSARFIIQLFLVPAVIVVAVIGIWLLFGKLASGKQDWQTLVAEIRSTNEHRRWRGAYGLAQMIQADAQRGENGEDLARNPHIAAELAGLMEEQLRENSQREDDLKQLAFLARTLGWIDVPGTVLPVLLRAMENDQDREVRKNSIAAIAQIAGRGAEHQQRLEVSNLSENIIAVSADSDPLIRQLGAYTLGLLPDEASRQRLTLLLQDADANTQLNAAIGLARQQSAAGLDVLLSNLQETTLPNAENSGESTALESESERERLHQEKYEQFVRTKNTLKAIADIAEQLSSPQRNSLVEFIQPISENHAEPKIRLEAKTTLQALEEN